jgi:dipeptidyl aminopeptidase/acylaminoacyl peptidase
MKKHIWLSVVLIILGAAGAIAGSLRAHRSIEPPISVFSLEEHRLHATTLIRYIHGYIPVQDLRKTNPSVAADSVLDFGMSTVLFGREQAGDWQSVWTLDKENGTIREIYKGVSMARLSPDGSRVVVTTGGNEVHLLTRDGVHIARAGVHGGSAVFSPDGQYLAYLKLSKTSADLELGGPKRSIGIAVYDINTGDEKLILSAGHGEYGVASWSPDGLRIYYLGERESAPGNWSAAMYSIRSDGSDRRLEVDPEKSSAPPFNSRTVWFPSLRLAVSEGDGVWGYLLDGESRILKSVRLSSGINLQALQPGASFAFENEGKAASWVVVDATKLRRALEGSGPFKLVDIIE